MEAESLEPKTFKSKTHLRINLGLCLLCQNEFHYACSYWWIPHIEKERERNWSGYKLFYFSSSYKRHKCQLQREGRFVVIWEFVAHLFVNCTHKLRDTFSKIICYPSENGRIILSWNKPQFGLMHSTVTSFADLLNISVICICTWCI